MNSQLPPGPRMPAALQTIAAWIRPVAFVERARRRYGPHFTLRMSGYPPLVMLSDPDEIKQLFLAAPDVVHAGEGARIVEPIVGRHSVGILDGDAHLKQRKLMLPAFHGERIQRLAGLMRELAERELAEWPREQPIPLHPRLQRLTLEVILQTVFGLEQGARLGALREVLAQILEFSKSPMSMFPMPSGLLARFGPVLRFRRLLAEADQLIFGLIAERRAAGEEGAGGDDVLTMLLRACHDDGSPMNPQELRDELVTLLFAAQETTATQLAWTFERLAREPAVQRRLREELDDGGGEEYMTAVLNEVMRLKPVAPYAQVGVVKRAIEIGGIVYPPGVALVANANLLHNNPAIYPEPRAFRPERFLQEPPGTYTWITFGGGRRRCLGASFAQLEMKLVLRTVLERCELTPVGDRPESTRRHNITIAPVQQCRVVVHERDTRQPPPQAPPARSAQPTSQPL